MNKICTSLEQSKKLMELGIDRKSSDMYYWCGSDLRIGGHKAQDEELDIPAWSLSALLRLIPNFNMFKRTIECKIETTNHLIDKACDPIDAAFEMVCWLKEKGKL